MPRLILATILVLTLAPGAWAQIDDPLLPCLTQAAKTYDLPPEILITIRTVEAGRSGQMSKNPNGTYDIGPMQINSHWLDKLAERYQTTPEVIKDKLLHNDCFNIHIGAWVLRREIDEAGGNFWRGVAHYHSRSRLYGYRYLYLVSTTARRLFGPDVFNAPPPTPADNAPPPTSADAVPVESDDQKEPPE